MSDKGTDVEITGSGGVGSRGEVMYQGGELFTIVRVSIIQPEKPPEDIID